MPGKKQSSDKVELALRDFAEEVHRRKARRFVAKKRTLEIVRETIRRDIQMKLPPEERTLVWRGRREFEQRALRPVQRTVREFLSSQSNVVFSTSDLQTIDVHVARWIGMRVGTVVDYGIKDRKDPRFSREEAFLVRQDFDSDSLTQGLGRYLISVRLPESVCAATARAAVRKLKATLLAKAKRWTSPFLSRKRGELKV